MSASSAVWDRHGPHTMSRNLFNFVMCSSTAVGIGTSAAAAQFTYNMEPFGLMLNLLVLVVCIVGVFIAMLSDRPIVSFLGYMMVTIPFGLLLGPIVALYTTASLAKVLLVTTGMVAILGVVGAVIPDSLEGVAPFLIGCLLLLLLGYFVVPIGAFFGLPIEGALTVLDWIGLLVFGVYVVFDFNRAQRVPRTMDNAIDCSLAIYLDFLNIFIRLLSIMGERDD